MWHVVATSTHVMGTPSDAVTIVGDTQRSGIASCSVYILGGKGAAPDGAVVAVPILRS